MVATQVDQTRIVALRQHVIRKCGGDNLGIGRDAFTTRAGKQGCFLDRQLQRLGSGLQRGRVLIRVVGKLAGHFVVKPILVRRRRLFHQRVAHLLERLGVAAADITQPDDVVTLRRQHGLGYLALGHGEHGRLERRIGHTPLQPAQVAALALGAQVLRILSGQLGKILGSRVGGNIVGLGQGGLLLLRRGVGGHVDEDVRNQALLRLHEALLLIGVALAQFLVAGCRCRREIRAIHFDVFHRNTLGVRVVGQMRLVVGVDLLIGHLGVGNRRTRQQEIADIATLHTQRQETFGVGRGNDGAGIDGAWKQLDGQIGANLGLEHLGRLALAGQHRAVGRRVEMTIDLERRDGCDVITHGLVGHRQAEIIVGLEQQLLVDHRIQHAQLHFRLFENAGVELIALLRVGALPQQVQPILHVVLADLMLADLRHRHVAAGRQVAFHAEKRHGENGNAQKDDGWPSMHLVTHCLQH